MPNYISFFYLDIMVLEIKILKIKMEDLAQIINETRTGVSKALNTMQTKGLVELHRGEIILPNVENLIN